MAKIKKKIDDGAIFITPTLCERSEGKSTGDVVQCEDTFEVEVCGETGAYVNKSRC